MRKFLLDFEILLDLLGSSELRELVYPGELKEFQRAAGFQERGREDKQAREAVPKVQEDGWEQRNYDCDSPCSQQAAKARGASFERRPGSGAPRSGGTDSDVACDARGTGDARGTRRLLHADVHDHHVDRPRQRRLR